MKNNQNWKYIRKQLNLNPLNKTNKQRKLKIGPKVEKNGERVELESLYAAIQLKLKTNNRAAYVPPQGTSPNDVNKKKKESKQKKTKIEQ